MTRKQQKIADDFYERYHYEVNKKNKEFLNRLKSRWTQYQWENENQIDWKSVFIGAGFLLVVIGGLIWLN